MKIRIDPLDKLASEYVRRKSRGYCERCGTYSRNGWESLQCCHFIGRSNRAVRYDSDNLVALCMGCHSYLDSHHLGFVEWFKQHLGEQAFDLLLARSRQVYPKPDKKLIELYLRAKIAEMER